MNASVKLGRLYGIPVGLHWSWFLVFALMSWSLASSVYAAQFPGQPAALHWGLATITTLLLFLSVLAHEFGHAIVSIRNGIPVRQITLFIFGGVAQIAQEPQRAGVEFRIAIAGPLVSVALAGAFAAAAWLAGDVNVLATPARWLAEINLSLVLFNMIPSFPLDGGRVFRAIVWALTHSYQKATRIATVTGQGIAMLFVAGGIFLMIRGQADNGLWFAFIGWFLNNAAVGARQYAQQHSLLADVRAGQVMDRRVAEVPGDLTVCELITENVFQNGKRTFIVPGERHPQGLVTMETIIALPRMKWDHTRVRDVMVPWERLVRVSPHSALSSVLHTMDYADIQQVPVVTENQVEGVLTRDQILRYLHQRQPEQNQ